MKPATKKGVPRPGKKVGQIFPAADNKRARSGISQNEPGGQFQKIEYFIKQPARGMHSEKHALAKEISEYCGEPKKFAMYLGIIKNIGLPRTYKIFAEIRQSKNVKDKGKLFSYLSSAKALLKEAEKAKIRKQKSPRF
jgi:hypothetical protein